MREWVSAGLLIFSCTLAVYVWWVSRWQLRIMKAQYQLAMEVDVLLTRFRKVCDEHKLKL